MADGLQRLQRRQDVLKQHGYCEVKLKQIQASLLLQQIPVKELLVQQQQGDLQLAQIELQPL
jgi:hypothetical protein